MIIEIKTDVDPRLNDPRYRTKLKLASEVYAGLGYDFVELVETRDLIIPSIRHAVRKIFLWRDTALSPAEIRLAQDCVGTGTSLGILLDRLGRGPAALAKIAALHCRRIICVSLGAGLADHSAVSIVVDAAR